MRSGLREVRFSLAARRDLAGIAAHIAGAAGRGIASQVITRIRVQCELLAQAPGEIGTSRPEIRQGVRSLPVPPHVIFFRYRGEEEVQVVRILHERQDVERHEID
ncbi:MAG: type II toxin-antitoxin system RelE/ParE family toxin [Gemmatimonadales bacterium]|nr:MAG: type II toxin-antitoxin system RelE/ParE family toxin [Gemmatimonadales bacterium]